MTRILLEAEPTNGYSTSIFNGINRRVHLLVPALRNLGHTVDVVGTQDSSLDCIRAPIYSRRYTAQHPGMPQNLNLAVWHSFLSSLAPRYDIIIVNHILNLSIANWDTRELHKLNAICAFDCGLTSFMGFHQHAAHKVVNHYGGHTLSYSPININDAIRLSARPRTQRELKRDIHRIVGGDLEVANQVFQEPSFNRLFTHNGIYSENSAPPQTSEGYIVTASRIEPAKNIEAVIELAARLGKHLVVCTMRDTNTQVTRNDYQDDLLDSLYANPNVTVLLNKPPKEVMLAIAKADLLAMGALLETFCQSVFEAFCHGVPVMCVKEVPAQLLVPELNRDWGKPYTTTTLAEREHWQELIKRTYTKETYAEKLLDCITNGTV